MTDRPFTDVQYGSTTVNSSNTGSSGAVDTAKQDASQVAGTAKQGASEVAQQTMEQAKAVTGSAKDHARELVGQTTSELRSHAGHQATRAADGLDQVARQVRALLEGRPDEAGQVRQYAEQLGDKAQQLAEQLRSRGVDGVMSDTGRLARRRPGLFLAGAAAAGFLVGRMVKAQASGSGGPTGPTTRAAELPYRTASYEADYPTAGYRAAPSTVPPLPDATTPPAADAIPSTGAGPRYGTSRASEPGNW
jgi:F0F1-type ATP synthase membrane subunit b/b'